MMKCKLFFVMTAVALLLASCAEDYMPKPKGFFRIYFPEKTYKAFESDCPLSFEYPTYSGIRYYPENSNHDQCWFDITYPDYQGKIHLSYKSIDGNLKKYIDDANAFVNKHIPKATSINNKVYINRESEVYGLVYNIEGNGAASSCQFYATDSINHFLRGSLYFSIIPNNDSMAPVIKFVSRDIEHLMSTLSWEKSK